MSCYIVIKERGSTKVHVRYYSQFWNDKNCLDGSFLKHVILWKMAKN